jgi:hypothetical protein
MEKVTNKTKSKATNKNNSKSVINRKEFLKLPLSERNKILRKQTEEILEHYEKDVESKEFQTLDVHDLKEETPPELTKEQIKLIKERLKRIDSGETKLMDWDDVKKKFSRFE